MGFTLKESQLALVLTPYLDDSGGLTGALDISIALPKDSPMDQDARLQMLEIATMMAGFLSYSEGKPDLVEDVIRHCDERLSREATQVLSPTSPTAGSA